MSYKCSSSRIVYVLPLCPLCYHHLLLSPSITELFDPLNQTSGGSSDKTGGATGSGAILETKQEDGVEEVIKQLEKKVNQLLEESAVANCERKYQLVSSWLIFVVMTLLYYYL